LGAGLAFEPGVPGVGAEAALAHFGVGGGLEGGEVEGFVAFSAGGLAGGLDIGFGIDGDGECLEAFVVFELADHVVGLEAAELVDGGAVLALFLGAGDAETVDAAVLGEERVNAEVLGELAFGCIAAAEHPSGAERGVEEFGLDGVNGLNVEEHLTTESFESLAHIGRDVQVTGGENLHRTPPTLKFDRGRRKSGSWTVMNSGV
jgi:hypothetical protein